MAIADAAQERYGRSVAWGEWLAELRDAMASVEAVRARGLQVG